MILRVMLLGLIACGIAGFGTIVWMVAPHGDTAVAATAPIARTKVLVAAKLLRPGALLKSDDLAAREIEDDKLPAGFVADDPNARRTLVGGLVRRPLATNDAISTDEVLRPGDHGFLAAVLRPGFRAVTVAVDAVSGTAGLIWPGDRVDLILVQQLTEPNQAPSRRIAAETVQRDVRVIAIDSQLVQGAAGPADAMPARTITLEVSSANAEQVQVATRLGRLSLSVRSAEHGPSEEKEGATWAGDVSSALGSPAVKPVLSSMRVYGGPGEGREFKF